MSKLIVNPYKPGPPVKGDDFYGRVDLLNEMLRNVQRSKVILLQGQRRIGKTSFLHKLLSLLKNEDFIPVFFDCQLYINDTLPQFQEHLAYAIAKELQISAPSLAELESRPAIFRETWIPKVFEHVGCRQLIFLVDEFDNFAELKNNKAIETLIPFINELIASELPLQWIFAVGRYIGKLPIQYDSILAKSLRQVIGRLNEDEMEDLIVRPVKGILTYESLAIYRIYQLTGGQPHLTQAMCSEIFESVFIAEGRNIVDVEDVENVIDQTLESYKGAINSIALVPPIEERVQATVTHLVIEGKKASRDNIIGFLIKHHISLKTEELDNALDRLVKWDLLVKEGPEVRPTIELISIWVTKNISLDPTAEERLDFLEARAQSRYEFAEKARSIGNYEIAIQDYEEALKYIPLHKETLRGLAEAYKITGNLAGRTSTLQKLYRQDRSILKELIDCMVDYAQQLEDTNETKKAAEQYKALINLQNNTQWQERLSRVLILEADKQLKADKQVRNKFFEMQVLDNLLETQHAIEHGITIVSETREVNELKEMLEKLKRAAWTISMRQKAALAEEERNWRAVGQILLALEARDKLKDKEEEEALKKAAYHSLFVSDSLLLPLMNRGTFRLLNLSDPDKYYLKVIVGGLFGIIVTLVVVGLLPEVADWGLQIYALLVALNIGIVKSLNHRYAARILITHLFSGSVVAVLLWFINYYVHIEFPPLSFWAYFGLISVAIITLAPLSFFGEGFSDFWSSIIAVIFYLIIGLIGTIITIFIDWLIIDKWLPQSIITAFSLSFIWIFTNLINFDLDSASLEEAKRTLCRFSIKFDDEIKK